MEDGRWKGHFVGVKDTDIELWKGLEQACVPKWIQSQWTEYISHFRAKRNQNQPEFDMRQMGK